MTKVNYNHTIYACFVGYVVQAININFAPLLFLRFQTSFHVSLSDIALVSTINFAVQMVVDFAAIQFVDRIGYRASSIMAHIFAAVGLAGLAFFPPLFAQPFHGVLLAVVLYAIGGGLLEAIISPIVESCPGDRKEGAMSLLHSFYCWGHVGVVLLSTLFFTVFGIEHWPILALIWALVPALNIIPFTRVPIAPLNTAEAPTISIKKMFSMKSFWLLAVLMMLSGASELAASQWASVYAESVLRVPKAVGDLAGPLLFATMMGLTRMFYGKYSAKLRLERAIALAAVLCLVSYLIIGFTTNTVLGFIGFALCGISVAIFWPGTLSLAAKNMHGGTAMFVFLALTGDIGCAAGPAFISMVSEHLGGTLQIGFLIAVIFPALLLLCFFVYSRVRKRERAKAS